MRIFKCIDHKTTPLKRWEMLYIHKIHQIKLIIVANYEWGIIKFEFGKDETHYKLSFLPRKRREGNFFFACKRLLKWEKEVGAVKILR
jgi:hypothetical protein